MFEYIFLIGIALVVIPLVYFMNKKWKMKSPILAITIIGLLTSLTGIFISQAFPFYYTILTMFGLAFVLSVLLDKYLNEKAAMTVEKNTIEVDKLPIETEQDVGVKLETAATKEVNDVVESQIEDDLANWMFSDQDDIVTPDKERVSSGE